MKAILTGHTRGLGQAVAADLLARGIPVLALARGENPGLAGRFPSLLQQVRIDLADPAAVLAWLGSPALDTWVAEAGTLLLINNAGMLGPVAPLGRQDGNELVRAVNLNVTVPLLLGDGLARRHPGPLRIVHVSSGAARTAYAGWSLYGATKAALDHHARCVLADARPGLRICSLAPGVIDTDMQAQIRATPLENFPLRGKFETLKESGSLSPPEACAAGIVDYLLSAGFGASPVADLRELG